MNQNLVNHAIKLFGKQFDAESPVTKAEAVLTNTHVEGLVDKKNELMSFPEAINAQKSNVKAIGCSNNNYNPYLSPSIYQFDNNVWIQKTNFDDAIKYFKEIGEIGKKDELPIYITNIDSERKSNAVFLRGKSLTYVVAEMDQEYVSAKHHPQFFSVEKFESVFQKPTKELLALVEAPKNITKDALTCMYLLQQHNYSK